MRRKWSASCRSATCSSRMGILMVRVTCPADRAARLDVGRTISTLGFAGTVRQDCLDHLKQPLTTMPQRSSANPESTPKIGNCPPQYGQRLPMCFSMDALTVARVHRFEVIQKVARRPVSDDKRRTFCVHETPSPKEARKGRRAQRPPGRPGYPGIGARPLLLHVRCLPCADHQRP